MSPASMDIGLYLAKDLNDWPLIMLFPALSSSFMDRAMGNPVNPAIYPNFMLNVGQQMTFFERVKNAASMLAMDTMASKISTTKNCNSCMHQSNV